MAEQQHVALVRRLMEEVWNEHRLEAIDELLALRPQSTADEHVGTVESLKQRVRVYVAAFPDVRVTLDQLLADDTDVMVRWTARGTHTGPLTGIPAAMAVGAPLHDQDSVLRIPVHVFPTGRAVQFQGVSCFRVEGGSITWYWLLMDDLSLLRQLGVLPAVQAASGPTSET